MRIAQTLQIALEALLEAGVRDMHVLVRLAANVGEIYGVVPDDPTTQTKSGTELSMALRALAGVRDSGRGSSRAAALELLDGLNARAERS